MSNVNAVTPAFSHFSTNMKVGTRDFSLHEVMMDPQSQPATVAIVDDDPAVCSSLKFSLEMEGFSVRAYASGAELLDAGKFEDCDCFVIDQRMPGLLGMDLIATLRSRRILTPAILLVSAPAGAVLSARAAKGGVPIIEKPLLGNTLFDMIRQACRRD